LTQSLVPGRSRCGSVRHRVTRSLVPVDTVGLSLLRCCSSSFVLASALLPSLSRFVPKVSREVCVCFHLFMCDSELRLGYRLSSFEKEFLSTPNHPPTPPSLVRRFGPSVVASAKSDFCILMSTIDGIASSLSDISSSSKREVNKSI
jgi:hypothetical protein